MRALQFSIVAVVATMLSVGTRQTLSAKEVTYAAEVSRLMQKRCESCHHDDGQAPFALTSYEQVKGHARTIKEAVAEKRMPPWHADPKYGKFLNDRRMPPDEAATLIEWIEAGMPQGDMREAPKAVEWPKDWRIGKPDLIIAMPVEYAVPAEGVVPYQNFQVDPGFTQDMWVERAEAKEGTATVHHILVFIFSSNARLGGGGGRPSPNADAPVLTGTAPGDMPLILQPGYAKKIPAGSRLVFQMHYTPNGKAVKDRSSIGLIFAKQPPKHEVRTRSLGKREIAIQPNTASHKEESTFDIDQNLRVLSFMPHMHLRGKSFEYRRVRADGQEETMLHVPNYDFNWQTIYRYTEHPVLHKGEKLHLIATWDNSKNNRKNPDPNRTVTWGEQTWDEMMLGWMDYVMAE